MTNILLSHDDSGYFMSYIPTYFSQGRSEHFTHNAV